MRDWREAPCVFIPRPPRPACPHCGWHDSQKIRTLPAESDGSQTQLRVCRACSRPWKLVVESAVPETGSFDFPGGKIPRKEDGKCSTG